MIVRVDATASVELVDADDCRQFRVESALESDGLAHALEAAAAGARARQEGHVWIWLDWLRMTVGAAEKTGPDWASRFDAMLDYARGKDWLDDEGRAVLGHVARL